MQYIVLPESAVDASTYKTAHRALASARKELKLPNVNIKFFVDARYKAKYQLEKCESFEETPINGLFCAAEPRTIYINALQMDDSLKNAVYHETYHLWQLYSKNGLSEPLAYEYSEYLAKQLAAHDDDDNVFWDHMAGKDWSVPTAKQGVQNKDMRHRGKASVKAQPDNFSEYPRVVRKVSGYIDLERTVRGKVR